MGWKDLLQATDETVVSPWVGGRALQTWDRTFRIEGRMPPEHGWHVFSVNSRKLRWKEATDAPFDTLKDVVRGYLVGDLLVPESAARVEYDLASLVGRFERVHLVEPGLDKFVRVSVGRTFESGPYIYEGQEMPLGPEDNVLQAFLDEVKSVDGVAGVPPALDAAFRVESWIRVETEKRRREERERREREERMLRAIEMVGTGQGRRELAQEDFGEAARAALAVGGASYLDHRQSTQRDEMVVRFRLDDRRYECTCGRDLRIIDSGICLTAHYDDPNFASGTEGDTWFTLESLPGVIREANNRHALVVYRHA
jgi:hypothetical protein